MRAYDFNLIIHFVVMKGIFAVIFGARKFSSTPMEISEHAISMHLDLLVILVHEPLRYYCQRV